MKKIFSKYKLQLTILLFFIILIISFFHFCFQPYEEYNRHQEKIKELERKLLKENREVKATKERYSLLFEEQKKLEENFLKSKNSNFLNSFTSFLEMEKEISTISQYFSLKTLSIGRIEEKENNRVFIPYIFSGELSSTLNFITTLENKTGCFSISNAPFSITTAENSRLEVKISGIINKNMNFSSSYPSGVKFAKIQKFNDKSYILLFFNDGTSNIFSENDFLNLEKIKYKLSIKENTVLFEKK